MARIYQDTRRRSPTEKKSGNPAQAALLSSAPKHAERPAEQWSHTFNVWTAAIDINATEAELKRPKDLACLIETSPGMPPKGQEGMKAVQGGAAAAPPAGGPAPSTPLNRRWRIVWHQWSCGAAGACHCAREEKKWAMHCLDGRGLAGVQPCSDQ